MARPLRRPLPEPPLQPQRMMWRLSVHAKASARATRIDRTHSDRASKAGALPGAPEDLSLLPPRGWPSRYAVHCQSPRCGRAECRGVSRYMQKRAREQRGSIGPTQIVRRRRERCLGLPHPARVDPCRRCVCRVAQNRRVPSTQPGLCVSRVPPTHPRLSRGRTCTSRIARTCIALLRPSVGRGAAAQLL